MGMACVYFSLGLLFMAGSGNCVFGLFRMKRSNSNTMYGPSDFLIGLIAAVPSAIGLWTLLTQ